MLLFAANKVKVPSPGSPLCSARSVCKVRPTRSPGKKIPRDVSLAAQKALALLNASQFFIPEILSQGCSPWAVSMLGSPPSAERCQGLGITTQRSEPARAGAARGYSGSATAFSAFKEILGCLGFPGCDSSGNEREMELQSVTSPDTGCPRQGLKTVPEEGDCW